MIHICICKQASCQIKAQTFSKKWSNTKNLPIISVKFEQLQVQALIDSGSMVPLIAESVYIKVKTSPSFDETNMFKEANLEAYGCNGSSLIILGVVEGRLQLHEQDAPIKAQFYILKQSTQECIIPHSWLSKIKAVLDYNTSAFKYELPLQASILTADGNLELDELTEENSSERNTPTQKEDLSSTTTTKRVIYIPPFECKTVTIPRHPPWPQCIRYSTGQGHGFVRKNRTGSKQILTFFNNSNEPLQLDPGNPLQPIPKPKCRIIPAKIHSWSAIPAQINTIQSPMEATLDYLEQSQSQFDHHTRSLQHVPLDKKKLDFLVPSTIDTHPFNEKSDPLTILYVYVMNLIGSNLLYMTKTGEELEQLISQTNLNYQMNLLRQIKKQYAQAKIQQMYSQMSIHLVHQLHKCFLKYQEKHKAEKKHQSTRGYLIKAVKLHNEMITEIKGLTALYFLNQKLINTFYEETLQHPYFNQLELPQSLQDTLCQLQKEEKTVQAVQIETPLHITSKQAFQDFIQTPLDPYEPKELTFHQYKEATQAACEQYTKEYEQELSKHPMPLRFAPESIAQVPKEKLGQFIEYSKSQSRLADFLKEQIPKPEPNRDTRTVSEILESIPYPKWVCYQSESEIIEDYIPNCFQKQFQEFFMYFSDPVFVRFSSEFQLPFPPTEAILETDPPDLLHTEEGLVDPRVLASTACQFLSHDHVVFKPEFKLELTLLSCIMFIYGQTGLSLHALDTGWFKQQFEVKTLLASNAPSSSFPPKQATETVSLDLDERLDFLKKQGKVAEICGSPFHATLNSVPKNYKTGKILQSTKTDPVLKYLSELPKHDKQRLADKSSEITKLQQELIMKLNDNSSQGESENTDQITESTKPQTLPESIPLPDFTVTQVILKARPMIESNMSQLTIYEVKSKKITFQSKIPPTTQNKATFFNAMDKQPRPIRNEKVAFGQVYEVTLEDPTDLRIYRERVKYSKYYEDYFLTEDDYHRHSLKQMNQTVGTKSKHLLEGTNTSIQNDQLLDKTPIKYISHQFPNIGQLANNKLDLTIADHQKYLANCNNIHFAILQYSSQAPQNKIADEEDPNYQMMKELATDPKYLIETHANSLTNTAPHQLVQFCVNLVAKTTNTVDTTNKNNGYREETLGTVQIKGQNTQSFTHFISMLTTSMRQLDHRRALRTPHTVKKNTIEILAKLTPHLQNRWETITLAELLNEFENWETFLSAISAHYQVPIVWIYVQVKQNRRLFQKANIVYVHTTHPTLYNDKIPSFAIIAINTISTEFYRFRHHVDTVKFIIMAMATGALPEKATMEAVLHYLNQPKPSEAPKQETTGPDSPINTLEESINTTKPRFTKVHYPHLDKSFYQKNAITRFILNSRHTNKLTRLANTQMQSQSDIIHNLGSSEMFSNYDLTAAYDAVPSCAISSLINTAAYRKKEYALLIASMGGSNSVLYSQRAVNSLMHRVNDKLLLLPCYKPCPVTNIAPALEAKIERGNHFRNPTPPSVQQSWSGQPLLELPAPQLIKIIQNSLTYKHRERSEGHNLPMPLEQRQQMLKQGSVDQILSRSALIDDLVCSSKAPNTKEYRELSRLQQTKLHLRIHILTLEAIFQSINILSQNPGTGPNFKATLKLKLEKSTFSRESIRYLNLIYIKGFQVINLDNFKKSNKHLEQLPANGDELRSALGFFNFLLSFCKSLRFHMKHLEAFATKHPAKKAIAWEKHPDIKQKYMKLCKIITASNSLQTLPADLNQLGKVYFNSDACPASLGYLIGFSLKPSHDNDIPRIKPFKFHSAKLPSYCQNLTILLKETLSSVLTLSQELPFLELLPLGCKKYLIIDSKPLFDLMQGYLKNGSLKTFFAAHATIPLWLSRLFQLVTAYNIQIVLMPTKLAPPADFLTRKIHSLATCQTITNKNECRLCEGCQVHCAKASPHKECPYSIGNGVDSEPSLIKFDKVQKKRVLIDNKPVEFQVAESEPEWEKYTPVNLATYLEVLGPNYDEKIEGLGLDDLFQEETNFAQMLQNGEEKQKEIRQATKALNQKVQTVNVTATHKLQIQTMPNNVHVAKEYFPRRAHTLIMPQNTTVVHFTTEKKNWNRPKTYIAKLLADTAIARMDLHVGQIEQITMNGTKFLTMCVNTGMSEPSVPLENLFPNLQACLAKAQQNLSEHIVYDYNSITQLHKINQWMLTQALAMMDVNRKMQHQIYISHPPIMLNDFHNALELKIPIIYNQLRQGVLTCTIPLTLNPKKALDKLQKDIAQEIENRFPKTANQTRKIGMMTGKTEITPLMELTEITKTRLILIKDKTLIMNQNTNKKSVQVQYQKETLFTLTWGDLEKLSGTLQQVVRNKTQSVYKSFQIQLLTPLDSQHSARIVNFNQYTQPVLTTNITLKELANILKDYPEINTLKLLGKMTSSAVNTLTNDNPQPADILRQLLGIYSNTLIAQATDQKIQAIMAQIQLEKKALIVKNCTFHIFESILFGKQNAPLPSTDVALALNYKPVIAESQIIPEILKTHQMLKCGRDAKVISSIKTRYFHQYRITSEISLEKMCKILLPCYICNLGRASHVRAPLYLETQTIGMQCVGLKSCTFTVMDVMYLTNTETPTFRHPYISVIVCQCCKFLSLQSIPRISSDNLATHLMQFCQLTGKLQTCLISDAASTQVAGEMKKLLKDFQIIHVTANQRIINTSHTQNMIETDEESDRADTDFPITKTHEGTPLDQIKEKHKQMLLQDVQQSVPALYNTVQTHHPVSYKSSDSSTETSMGSLDNICKKLQIFLKKFFLDVPVDSRMDDHVEHLISSFVYIHNFKMKAQFTNEIPAKIHLGLMRSNNILSLMDNIQRLQQPESEVINNMKQLLQFSDMFRKAELNAQKVQDNQKRRQLRQHGKLLDEDNLVSQLKPFTVIYVKAELGKVPKMHFYAQYCGPFLILSINPRSKSFYLFSLLSGEVHKKSYRQIKLAFHNEVFSLPLFGQLGEEVQFKMINNLQHFTRNASAEEIMSHTQKILINLHKLLTFLKPILPRIGDIPKPLQLSLEDEIQDDRNETTLKGDKEDHKQMAPDPQVHPEVKQKVKFSIQDHIPEENQMTDLNGVKPKQNKLTKQGDLYKVPEERTDNENSPQRDKAEGTFVPSRKDQENASEFEGTRPEKYNLRRNPKKKLYPDFE